MQLTALPTPSSKSGGIFFSSFQIQCVISSHKYKQVWGRKQVITFIRFKGETHKSLSIRGHIKTANSSKHIRHKDLRSPRLPVMAEKQIVLHLVGTTFFTSLALDFEATLVFLPMDKEQLEKWSLKKCAGKSQAHLTARQKESSKQASDGELNLGMTAWVFKTHYIKPLNCASCVPNNVTY